MATPHKEVDDNFDHLEGGHDSDALVEVQLKLRFAHGFVRVKYAHTHWVSFEVSFPLSKTHARAPSTGC